MFLLLPMLNYMKHCLPMHNSHVLAADVGGTNIRAAWVDDLGNIKGERRIQADLSRDDLCEEDVLHILTGFFHAYLSESIDIQAIGLGFPGFFLGDTGVLLASPNLPQLKNIALAKKLSEQLSLPVFVQNDALCAALGEHRFGRIEHGPARGRADCPRGARPRGRAAGGRWSPA